MIRFSIVCVCLVVVFAGCGGQQPAPAPSGGESLNGCDAATATDWTGRSEVRIRFGGAVGHAYDPSCVRVSAGTRVTFVGDFAEHPLAPGELGAPAGETGSAGPLSEVASGESASFVMERPGDNPYLCNLHAWDGMMGAIFVSGGEETSR